MRLTCRLRKASVTKISSVCPVTPSIQTSAAAGIGSNPSGSTISVVLPSIGSGSASGSGSGGYGGYYGPAS
jgi:hypothetical protein